MTQKWNLQDIKPAGTTKGAPRETPLRKPQIDISYKAPKSHSSETVIDPDIAMIDVIDGKSEKRKRVIITVVVASIIIGAGFFVNVMLGGADVTVHPKLKDISVQAEFRAETKPQAGELGYELLTLEETGEKQVKASGKETVSLKAEGKIFVYNAKSTSPQRLIKNTRFENKDGLIFRIKESIEVPGATTDTKGALVPGSIVADVVADGTGDQYNIPPGRFTVPGLKDTEQYEHVYGESTTGFTGGFEGEKYIIDEAEFSTAKQALHVELRDKLLAKLKEARPAGFVVYDDAVTFAFDSLPSTEYGESLATIKEKARLQVPMFKESEFSSFLADKTIPDYTGDLVSIIDPLTLTFSYTAPTTTVSDISTYTALDFMLKGDAKVVWKFDEKKLQNDLISLKKSEAPKVFSSYPAISSANAEIRPFWVSVFPKNPDEIKVHIVE